MAKKKPEPAPEQVLDVKEAAQELGVHEVTFRNWIAEHKIDVIRHINRRISITRSALDKFKAEREKQLSGAA